SNASTAALLGLLRTGILKRFESSAFAFVETLKRLERGCEVFLKGLAEGKVLRGRGLVEIEDLSDTDAWSDLIAEGEWESTEAYKVQELREAVEADRDVFADLIAAAEPLTTLDNP